MTLDEAIRRNEAFKTAPILRDNPKAVETFQFNIKALKFIKDQRRTVRFNITDRLPGETEERTIQRQGKDIFGNYSYEESKP